MIVAVVFIILSLAGAIASCAEKKVAVQFTGGHETDRQDGGRPIVLVAAGLGVKPEVFREAFRGVTPAKNGRPSGEEARRNKAALMKVLQPHGVSNDRLDEVSDYYRYQPQRGELWKHTPAEAHAIVEGGKILRIEITNPGSGYSSLPQVAVPGFDKAVFEPSLHFDQDLKKNGSLTAVTIVRP